MTGTATTHTKGPQVKRDFEVASPSRGAPTKRATPSRVLLQRRATATIRRHLRRSVARVAVVLTADFGAFLLVRWAIGAVREGAVLGDAVAVWIARALPTGYLGGWQFVAALVLGLLIAGSYGRGDCRRDVGRLFAGVALAAALSLWQGLWQVGLPVVALQFALTVPAVWLVLVAERSALDVAVSRLVPERHRVERTIFVGDPADPKSKLVYRRLVTGNGMTSLGWVHGNGAGEPGQYLGSAECFWDVLRQTYADTVVLCGELSRPVFESVVEASAAAGCSVLSVSRYAGVTHRRSGVVWHRGIPLVELTVPSLRAQQLVLKRMIDVIGAAVGLVLLSPLFAALAVAIRLDSPGPVFFSQERVGYGGRVFRLLKFRTMREGAEGEKDAVAYLNCTGDPRLFKIPQDPRVTRLGAGLRRWSLDELPQLWNVLRGHMSLVGPRPFFEPDLAHYSDHHFIRLGAKPGVTGLWQVNGRSAVTDFEEVVRLDREYIDRWSVWLDLKILLVTLPAVFRRTGAY